MRVEVSEPGVDGASVSWPPELRRADEAPPPGATPRVAGLIDTGDRARVRLDPVTPADHRFLYELATSSELSYRWRYRNQIPRYEAFVQQLDVDVLAQFVVRHLPDDAPVGHVVAYGPDLANGYATVGGIFTTGVLGLHIGAEALSVFIDYLFGTWDLSKLYAEVPEFVYETIRDRLVEPFELEARFRRHLYFGGRHWDLLVFAVTRAEWPGAQAWEFNPRRPGPRRASTHGAEGSGS